MTFLELISSGVFILWFSVIALVATVIALEVKEEGWGTTFVCLGLALIGWNYWEGIWGFVSQNIGTSILFLLGYLGVGVAWSFLKWNEFVKDTFALYNERYKVFINTYKEFNKETKQKFCQDLRFNGFDIYADKTTSIVDVVNGITPEGLKNKSIITAWISYWPLSLIGTLLNNPFRRLVEYIFSRVSGIYDNISLKHRANVVIPETPVTSEVKLLKD